METINSHIENAAAPAKSEAWKRGLIMLALMFAFGVGQSILYLLAVAQFLWLLIAKEPNSPAANRIEVLGKVRSVVNYKKNAEVFSQETFLSDECTKIISELADHQSFVS